MKILILWNDGSDSIVDSLTEHLQSRLGAFRCAYKTPKDSGLDFVYHVYANGVFRYL